MAFTSAFIAHAPDADADITKAFIETPKYRLFVHVVRNQEQAIDTAKALVAEEGVQSFLLCPGFTNRDVAEMQEAVGDGVAVCVARGDSPSSRIAGEIIAREWFQ